MTGRIRTVKPEFFRSPNTAKVSFPGRIFYEALWCWADDFGIGETNINGLLGFAFCDSDTMPDPTTGEPRAVSAQDVRGFCAEVAQHFQVNFYEVRGRYYYSIPSWESHQKTEKRSQRRKHPTPDDPDAVPDLRFQPRAESAPESPRKSGADSRQFGAGTGEQGNRGKGTGEARPPVDETTHLPNASDLDIPPEPLIDDYEPTEIETAARPTRPTKPSSPELSFIRLHVGQQLPRDIEAQLVTEVRKLKSFDTPVIEAALQNWATRDCSPKLLSNLVSDELKRRRAPAGNRPRTPTAREQRVIQGELLKDHPNPAVLAQYGITATGPELKAIQGGMS